MKRKIVQTGTSLAVTLPKEVVDELKLQKGDEVDVSIHPQSRAVIVRAAMPLFDNGEVTDRFRKMAEELLDRHRVAFERLSK